MSKLNFFSSSEYITCTESIINNKKVPEINCDRNYATNPNKHTEPEDYTLQEKIVLKVTSCIETCNYNYTSQERKSDSGQKVICGCHMDHFSYPDQLEY